MLKAWDLRTRGLKRAFWPLVALCFLMSNYSEIEEQGERRICNLENRTINGATYQPKQSKNQQNGKKLWNMRSSVIFPS